VLAAVRAAGLDATDGDGVPATEPEYRAAPELVATLLGTVLGRLHATAVVPPDAAVRRPADLVDGARRRLASGSLEVADLPEAYRHVRAERLVELLAHGAERSEARWAPVVVHGAPTIDALRCRDGVALGLADWTSAAVADRHLDLAVAATDLAARCGPMVVPTFAEAYSGAAGVDGVPDPLLLDWCALAVALVPSP
jgi:aminoglycoside phosphotransferase